MAKKPYLAPALVRFRSQVNALWPNRSKLSDGWIGDAAHSARKSDHNPAASGVVRAFDVTINGIDVGRTLNAILSDRRVEYVIFNERIATRNAQGVFVWRKYTGTNRHDKHIHISLRHDVRMENDASDWAFTPVTTTRNEDLEMIILYAGGYPNGVLFAGGGQVILTSAEEKKNLIAAGAKEAWVEKVTLDEIIASARGKYDIK